MDPSRLLQRLPAPTGAMTLLPGAALLPGGFVTHDGGYKIWQEYAESLDKGDIWQVWSEDESCAQRDQTDDVAVSGWSALTYCDL